MLTIFALLSLLRLDFHTMNGELTFSGFRWTAVWLLTALAMPFAGAQSPVLEAQTSTPEVVQGNVFEVGFILKNGDGIRFKAPDFKGFKVISGPNELRSMTIVNGQTSAQMRWSYELEATETGTFEIGTAAVFVDGKPIRSKPLAIRVIPAQVGRGGKINMPPGADSELFLSAELNMTDAYVGQQVCYRLNIYTLVSLEGADLISLPDFDGFETKEKKRFDTRVQYVTQKGKKYAVKTLYEQAIYPRKSGDLLIGGAKVKAGVTQGGAFGPFSMPKPVVLQSAPIKLTVLPLPEPMPDNFSGAVGRYEWEVEAAGDSLSTDDALTLTVNLRGNGNPRLFQPQKWPLPPGLEMFDPKIQSEETYENGEQVLDSKTLEFVILPKEPGVYSFSPELIYFNPDSNRYCSLRTDAPVQFYVAAGKNYSLPTTPAEPMPEPESPPPTPRWAWLLGLGVGLLLFGGGAAIWLMRKRRKKQAAPSYPADVAALPSQVYKAPAQQEKFSLQDAERHWQAGDDRAFYYALLKWLQHYLAAKLQLSATHPGLEVVLQALQTRRLSTEDVQLIWESCEQAVYGRQAMADQMADMLRRAKALQTTFDRAFR